MSSVLLHLASTFNAVTGVGERLEPRLGDGIVTHLTLPVGAGIDPASPEGRLQRCLDQMEADLAHPWSLDALAETVHLESAYFSRLFKRAFGVSPLTYLRSRRMEEAKRLLAVS